MWVVNPKSTSLRCLLLCLPAEGKTKSGVRETEAQEQIKPLTQALVTLLGVELGTYWEQETTVPACSLPAPLLTWSLCWCPYGQVWVSCKWCGGEKSGQWHLVNSQTKAWSSSCYSQEGLLTGSVPERGLRKFSANVIAFLICTKNK